MAQLKEPDQNVVISILLVWIDKLSRPVQYYLFNDDNSIESKRMCSIF